MTQSEVAQTVSKGRSTIANALRLLDLPEEAQQLLFEEKITAGHARAILSVPTLEGKKSLTNKLMEEKLSVRETEAIARLLAGGKHSFFTRSYSTELQESCAKHVEDPGTSCSCQNCSGKEQDRDSIQGRRRATARRCRAQRTQELSIAKHK